MHGRSLIVNDTHSVLAHSIKRQENISAPLKSMILKMFESENGLAVMETGLRIATGRSLGDVNCMLRSKPLSKPGHQMRKTVA
jgi:hypothetical protein